MARRRRGFSRHRLLFVVFMLLLSISIDLLIEKYFIFLFVVFMMFLCLHAYRNRAANNSRLPMRLSTHRVGFFTEPTLTANRTTENESVLTTHTDYNCSTVPWQSNWAPAPHRTRAQTCVVALFCSMLVGAQSMPTNRRLTWASAVRRRHQSHAATATEHVDVPYLRLEARKAKLNALFGVIPFAGDVSARVTAEKHAARRALYAPMRDAQPPLRLPWRLDNLLWPVRSFVLSFFSFLFFCFVLFSSFLLFLFFTFFYIVVFLACFLSFLSLLLSLLLSHYILLINLACFLSFLSLLLSLLLSHYILLKS